VSAQGRRAGREGEAHAAARTSSNNTPESFIVGVGASGALLAGAAIVFVTLVGLVSFNVWPTGQALIVGGNVELNAPTPAASTSNPAASPSAASGQLASTNAGAGVGAGGGATGGGNSQGGNDQGGNGSKPKGGVSNPPTTTVPPTDNFSNSGDTGSTPSTPGNASKDPAHPIHPVHPDRPHQSDSDGPNGKDDEGTGNDSGDVITGKGPFTKPTPPSSASTDSDSSNGNGHGSQKYKH
jgi:hypothetical protein